MNARTPPNVSSLTRPFWEAAARHELVRPVCDACGSSFFTPQVACPQCLSENWRWRASTGRGVIHSHTTVHRAPRDGFDPPYVVADVDLEEGWRMLTNIVGCDPAAVHIGQPVAVVWLTVDEGITLPVFEPDDRETL